MKNLSLIEFRSEDKQTPFAPTWDYKLAEVDIDDVESVPLKENASAISFDNFEKENASEKNRKKISVTESDIQKLIETNRKEMQQKQSEDDQLADTDSEK